MSDWPWLMRFELLRRIGWTRTAVRYPTLARAQRIADRHFRSEPVVSVEHENTGELWVRERGQWRCERPANNAAWLEKHKAKA